MNVNRIKHHTSRNLIIHRQCIESCMKVENQRQTYVQELQITIYLYSYINVFSSYW